VRSFAVAEWSVFNWVTLNGQRIGLQLVSAYKIDIVRTIDKSARAEQTFAGNYALTGDSWHLQALCQRQPAAERGSLCMPRPCTVPVQATPISADTSCGYSSRVRGLWWTLGFLLCLPYVTYCIPTVLQGQVRLCCITLSAAPRCQHAQAERWHTKDNQAHTCRPAVALKVPGHID
jgi:hypothetical protein